MECRICYETVTEDAIKVLGCSHSLCQICLSNLRNRTCPFCRAPIETPIETLSPQLLPLIISPSILHIETAIPTQSRRRIRHPRTFPSRGQVPLDLTIDEVSEILDRMYNSIDIPKVSHNNSTSDRIKQKQRNRRNRYNRNFSRSFSQSR